VQIHVLLAVDGNHPGAGVFVLGDDANPPPDVVRPGRAGSVGGDQAVPAHTVRVALEQRERHGATGAGAPGPVGAGLAARGSAAVGAGTAERIRAACGSVVDEPVAVLVLPVANLDPLGRVVGHAPEVRPGGSAVLVSGRSHRIGAGCCIGGSRQRNTHPIAVLDASTSIGQLAGLSSLGPVAVRRAATVTGDRAAASVGEGAPGSGTRATGRRVAAPETAVQVAGLRTRGAAGSEAPAVAGRIQLALAPDGGGVAHAGAGALVQQRATCTA